MNCLKRKRVVTSLEHKLEALERLDRGESLSKVARYYGVRAVTVGDWKRNRQNIEKWCTNTASHLALKRKKMRKSTFEDVGEALFLWYTHSQKRGIPVSRSSIQEKALNYYKRFNNNPKDDENKFKASSGWLDRWKKRYGINKIGVASCENADISNDNGINEMDFVEAVIKTEEVEEEMAVEVEEKIITHDQALAALETAVLYVEQQPEASECDKLLMRTWRDIAARKKNQFEMDS